VLELFGSETIGVLMTGMGDDGANTMVKIRQAGGMTIAESEESAIVFGMPREAIERGGAQKISPSWEIADQIIKAVK
ncbi:MAG: chemotaxis protein CheB, partial [Syntrophobacteraceae bacterium]